MFQKALKFKDVIILCYNRQNIVKINERVPPLFTWHIFKIIVDFLSPVVTASVLTNLRTTGLLSDAL